eukprot:3026594-Amphidinium_carterae.1
MTTQHRACQFGSSHGRVLKAPPIMQKTMPKPRVILKECASGPVHAPPQVTQEQHRVHNCPAERPPDAPQAPEPNFNTEGHTLRFSTARFGGQSPTADLMVEPALTLLGRNFRRMRMSEDGTLQVELGREEASTIICFPSREQFQHQTRTLDAIADST